MEIAIIDYGVGNLRSASKALEYVAPETKVRVTRDPDRVKGADYIVLPGDGAYAHCRNSLAALPGMIDSLYQAVWQDKKPFLGICVGMQLMASVGWEYGETKGLDWIAGDVVALKPRDSRLKVPHMGWNSLVNIKPHPVLADLAEGSFVYFVHSYHFVPVRDENCLAATVYGEDVMAIVGHENMIGTQFHPEKSQKVGLNLLRNFVNWSV